MIQRILLTSRYLILIAVIGCFVAASTLLIYGGIEVFLVVTDAIAHGVTGKEGKKLALRFIELVDLFLLGTVFYIIAIGLYELFIDKDIPVPAWLKINDLNDLKNKLISVVIVVMGVLFLGQVVTWDGERDLLPFGAAIALVIVALTYFFNQVSQKTKGLDHDEQSK